MAALVSPSPTRPVLRWHGGKWRLAPWIIGHLPAHRVYVEPFGGAASVLLRKARSYAEVYNDLDQRIVNLFRVLRDPERADRLMDLLWLTPYARVEFDSSGDEAVDPIEAARRLIVRSSMAVGSRGALAISLRTASFNGSSKRASDGRRGPQKAHAADWANHPESLRAIVERLRGVIIECADALELMKKHDSQHTLHYVDPPYVQETRSPSNHHQTKYRMYRHDLDAVGHTELLAQLRALKGMVVLSGYPSAVYDAALRDWRRVTREAYADGARKRTEVLWINPQACARLDGVLDLGRVG